MGSTQATVTSEADTTSAVELSKVSAEFQIANRLHGTRFRYVLYEEGYLKIWKWKKNKLVREYYLSLRFMTPEYKVTRVVAKQAIYATAAMGWFLPLLGDPRRNGLGDLVHVVPVLVARANAFLHARGQMRSSEIDGLGGVVPKLSLDGAGHREGYRGFAGAQYQ